MKGDFTRFTFRPQNHYSGVLQQQGRVQLDADWNEQVEIGAYRNRILAADLIGLCGAPERGGGFAVSSTEDGDLRISAGRLYVAGTLCELDAATTYLQQPDLPRPTAISPTEGRTDLVYLDVWQRFITAVEDPNIREPALGGADTATRLRTVWQAKILTDVQASDCEDSIDGWPPPASDARLAATIGGGPAELPAAEEQRSSPSGGYAPLENALYRIEIHDTGPVGGATFKWSRDNGSILFPVRELIPATPDSGMTRALVERMGQDPRLALEEGDWVEALGDETELMLSPGTMVRVDGVDEGQQIVLLDGDLSAHAGESHLKLRRWDGGGTLPVTEGNLELEEGIEIRFSGRSFSTGDYWMFPVRNTQSRVEWSAASPRGIRHDYCKLAFVTWQKADRGVWTCAVTNCRRLFGSLARGRADGCRRCEAEIADLRASLAEQARELRELQARLR